MHISTAYSHLTCFNGHEGCINAVIETPKGSANKFNYDQELGLFKLGGVLPAGMVFPFDFGFVPDTLGEDGDPLDVLVLMDQSTFTGCLLTVRPIGVIEANQTEDGKTGRNDRLIAVAEHSNTHKDTKSLKDLNRSLLDEIEQFFVSYNRVRGKKFKVLKHSGPRAAKSLLEVGIQRLFAEHHGSAQEAA